MPAIDIKPWVHELLGELSVNQQRQLVILQGSESWCDAQLQVLRQLQLSMLTLSNRPMDTESESGRSPVSSSLIPSGPIPFSKADTCLGREAKLVVLDLFTGFNPDVLCIAAGLVQAGGILVLLSAEIKHWQQDADLYSSWQEPAKSVKPRFAEYFFAAFDASDDIGLRVTPEALPAPKTKLPVLQATQFEQGVTLQQSDCMQRIEHWLDLDRPGVALIRAQRGRGKSSCLGMLVERLAKHRRVLVCADSRRTAAALLQFAPQAEFVAPDRLLLSNPEADLVVIDEAAMITQSILRQINRLYPRLLMATTTGGYEGTGQGFMLRFIAELESRNLLQLELHDPVRWCSGDRLECRLNQILLQDRLDEFDLPDNSDKPIDRRCRSQPAPVSLYRSNLIPHLNDQSTRDIYQFFVADTFLPKLKMAFLITPVLLLQEFVIGFVAINEFTDSVLAALLLLGVSALSNFVLDSQCPLTS